MSDDREIRFLGDVQRLTLGPNDIVILKVPTVLHPSQAVQISDQLRKTLGEDRKVIVLDGGADLGLLCAAPPPADTPIWYGYDPGNEFFDAGRYRRPIR